MVIDGNGLIAAYLSKYRDVVDDAHIFARGVSNSACKIEAEYSKEEQYLLRAIDQCRRTGMRLVYFSSGGAVYGDTGYIREENTLLVPVSRYGRHKCDCEKAIEKSGVRFLILRLPNVVGPYGNASQLFPYLVKSVMLGKVKVLNKATRDLIDVEDMSSIVAELLKKTKDNLIVNIASGIDVSVLDLVNEISKYIGRDPELDIVQGGDRQYFSIERLQHFLPTVSFDQSYPYSLVAKYVTGMCHENI